MSTVYTRFGAGERIAVAFVIAAAVALRVWHLDAGWFGIDQARDVQTALDIGGGGDWPTVGPTMRRVTSLGALYYYVWALPYLVSTDPLAGYVFAAGLGTGALVATWAFARRFWGVRAGLVALAVFAASPVAVIDGRVAWAPAALPIVAITIVWLAVGTPTPMRAAVLGAVLGVAVQLHLSMVAFGVALLRLLVARPGWRALAAIGLGFTLTAWPAAYAAFTNAGNDAGLASLSSRGPAPDFTGRLAAVFALGWRVPEAFWRWPDAPAPWPLASRGAGVVLALLTLLGALRLALAGVRGDRAAAVVVAALACQIAMVVLLPGEAWYYYLDAALPLLALATGFAGADRGATLSESRTFGVGMLAAGLALVAAMVLGVHVAAWIAVAARHAYLVVDPAALTLDGAGGRDAAAPGRLVSAGTKRAVAALLGKDPADFPGHWHATHGPAFDDVTGDNGFWLRRASSSPVPASPARHATLWYRDDPTAPPAGTAGIALDRVGPIVVVRYTPTIVYESCRDDAGPVTVPIRLVPHPRRYGDGTIARPQSLPARITCNVATGTGGTRVVATVTNGTVTLRASGDHAETGRTSTLCVERGERPVPFTIEVATAGAASDLDLYERPDSACAAKIAP